jgi:methionine-rich copper-binding protein CopC
MSPRAIFTLRSPAKQNELPMFQQANFRALLGRFHMKFSHGLKLTFLLLSGMISHRAAISHDGWNDTLAIDLKTISAGNYSVEWQALSVDTHVTDGTLRFSVAAPAK